MQKTLSLVIGIIKNKSHTDAYTLLYDSDKFEGKKGDRPHVHLPSGDWQIVGNPFDLSEEQAIDLFGKEHYNEEVGCYLPVFGYWGFKYYKTAKEALKLMLDYLKVYRVNPYKGGKPSLLNHDLWYSEQEWQEAEERTGNYILLTAVKA